MLNLSGVSRRHVQSSNRRWTNARLGVERLEEREVLSASTLYSIGSGVYDLSQTFLLQSNPGANQTVYLDFDGHTNGDVYGTSWDNIVSPAWDYSGNGAAFTDTEKQIIQRIWARVSEDFAPFNINVTTQDPGVEALRRVGTSDVAWGVRVVFTGNDQPAPGSGGVAYVGSFNFSTDTPVYVFNVGEKGAAEAATHEVGHSLGLSHDGTGTLAYYGGQGSGVTPWGPIMGASYNVNVTQWSKGEYSGANQLQDDLNIITTQNGFTYRSDDYGNTQAAAFQLLPQGSSVVSATYGLIERNSDADYFSFWSNAGAIALNVDPLPLGPNLAVRADLYDANGTLLTTVNPAGQLNAPVNFTLGSAGQYFLKITGTGKGDPLTTGFSNYASLGNYRISGTVQAYTGGGPTNQNPIANNDTASTTAGVPVTVNVLANDSDPNGDSLFITSVGNIVGGTAVISGSSVIFTPAAGFSGNASFSYSISDGHGGAASATANITVNPQPSQISFTNNTDVVISSTKSSTIVSTINVSGLTGTLQDVDVKVNIQHTYVSDLRIVLIAPDGTRITLFYRHGGSGDNLVNTVFDDAASSYIGNAAAPFTGSFRPYQLLSALNGKNPNGAWKLEIRDYYRADGGFLDNWTLSLRTGTPAPPAPAASSIFADLTAFLGNLRESNQSLGQFFSSYEVPPHLRPLFESIWIGLQSNHNPNAGQSGAVSAKLKAVSDWLADHGFSLEGDLPAF